MRQTPKSSNGGQHCLLGSIPCEFPTNGFTRQWFNKGILWHFLDFCKPRVVEPFGALILAFYNLQEVNEAPKPIFWRQVHVNQLWTVFASLWSCKCIFRVNLDFNQTNRWSLLTHLNCHEANSKKFKWWPTLSSWVNSMWISHKRFY